MDDFFDFVEGDLDGVGAGFEEGLEVADVPYSVVGSEIEFSGGGEGEGGGEDEGKGRVGRTLKPYYSTQSTKTPGPPGSHSRNQSSPHSTDTTFLCPSLPCCPLGDRDA